MEEYNDYSTGKHCKDLRWVFVSLLEDLKGKDNEGTITEPVDYSKVGGHLVVITRPMDLEKMSYEIRDFGYKSYADFMADFHLIINNARKFNHESTHIYKKACELEEFGTQQITEARFAEMLSAKRKS